MVEQVRQAGAAIEITEEMIEAGVNAYQKWEPDHVFEGIGGVAPYAVRDLVKLVYRAMVEFDRNIQDGEAS
jgi:hypothetical protein